MHERYFITTSIPYVNAKPHIGHALELIQTDALARYFRLQGARVIFQTGTDENAGKNVTAAKARGIAVQKLVDENAERFRRLVSSVGADPQLFVRTSEPRHRRAVELLWQSLRRGDIYLKSYRGLYCEGCEDFIGPRDLVDGRCPDHPTPPVEIEERNYFFRLSNYQQQIETLIEQDTIRIHPAERKREVLAFVRSGLRDISISRDARRMSGWGIPVPGDAEQVIYVWIDALVNYISGSGYGSTASWAETWNEGTTKIHVIGKNVWKFHAVYWPALLLSARLPLPDSIVVHGFLTVDGRKISKSVGNVIDPQDEIHALGRDALRLYLLSLGTFGDGDYSRNAAVQSWNDQVARRLGSTVTRVTALCRRHGVEKAGLAAHPIAPEAFHAEMSQFRIDRALEVLLRRLDSVNAEIAQAHPWEVSGSDDQLAERLAHWVQELHVVGYWLLPFAPGIGEKVCEVLSAVPIRKPTTLFPRRSNPARPSPSPA